MIARLHHASLGILVVAIGFTACQPSDGGEDEDARAGAEPGSAALIEVVARDYAFEAPEEIPSGWTTFQLRNEGKEHHFLLLQRLPEGISFDQYMEEAAVPFDTVMQALNTEAVDKAEAGAMLGELLPEWFFSVRQMGGPGLVAPGGAAQATVKLEPGEYVMECYVKNRDGVFHGMLGMTRPLTVTDNPSGGEPPEADIEIALSNDGMAIEGDVAAGEHTVAVHFREHPEFGLGNDVHVVRLADDTDMDVVLRWMDWMNVDGLREPAPAAFVGGAHEMPVGYTAYFSVDLTPGRYAWIAETSADRGMAREFLIE